MRYLAPLICLAAFAFAAPASTTWENPVKKNLREGKPVVGMTVTVASADVVLQAARLGFDFVCSFRPPASWDSSPPARVPSSRRPARPRPT
jgi:hypothetical protein